MHQYNDLINIFNQCFSISYNTRLVKGGDEPIYLPKDQERAYHAIFFAHGFFSSALHECAHWCIAGEARRQLIDFGYWYEPDGRNPEQQKLFEVYEVKPQALEWVFSKACQYPFRISLDNLNGEISETKNFKNAIMEQIKRYCQQGLPKRAQVFYDALCEFYHQPKPLVMDDFLADK